MLSLTIITYAMGIVREIYLLNSHHSSHTPFQGISEANVGDAVIVKDLGEGTLRFYGPCYYSKSENDIWLGIELSAPQGSCDGAIEDERYFICEPKHGYFVQLSAGLVTLLSPNTVTLPPLRRGPLAAWQGSKSSVNEPAQPVNLVNVKEAKSVAIPPHDATPSKLTVKPASTDDVNNDDGRQAYDEQTQFAPPPTNMLHDSDVVKLAEMDLMKVLSHSINKSTTRLKPPGQGNFSDLDITRNDTSDDDDDYDLHKHTVLTSTPKPSAGKGAIGHITALHRVAGAGLSSRLQELIDESPHMVDALDENGRTPLMHAVHYNRFECAMLLIECGANVSHQEPATLASALHEAAYRGSHVMMSGSLRL